MKDLHFKFCLSIYHVDWVFSNFNCIIYFSGIYFEAAFFSLFYNLLADNIYACTLFFSSIFLLLLVTTIERWHFKYSLAVHTTVCWYWYLISFYFLDLSVFQIVFSPMYCSRHMTCARKHHLLVTLYMLKERITYWWSLIHVNSIFPFFLLSNFIRNIFMTGKLHGEWILGSGWNNDLWGGELPLASWIDGITPDNPVGSHAIIFMLYVEVPTA